MRNFYMTNQLMVLYGCKKRKKKCFSSSKFATMFHTFSFICVRKPSGFKKGKIEVIFMAFEFMMSKKICYAFSMILVNFSYNFRILEI